MNPEKFKASLNLHKIKDERKHASLEVESLRKMLELVVSEIKRLESQEDFNIDKEAQSKHKDLTEKKLEIELELVRKEIEKLKEKLTKGSLSKEDRFQLDGFIKEESKIKEEMTQVLQQKETTGITWLHKKSK